MKIALLQVNPTVGDLSGNAALILDTLRRAADAGADLAATPELALERVLTGEGGLQVERGYVRREDETAFVAATIEPDSEASAATSGADGGDQSASPIQRTTITVAGQAGADEEEDDDAVRPLPDRLVAELTAHRTLALRDADPLQHAARVGGGASVRRVGDAGEVFDVDQRRHQRGAVLDHQLDGVVGQPAAVLDTVDAGRDEAGQGVLAEHVRGHPHAVVVGGVDRLFEDLVGPQRRQVADIAVDPVADQLDPTVTPAGLLGHRVGQLRLILQLDGEPALVTLRPGQMPARADDAGQVVVVVEAAGVRR